MHLRRLLAVTAIAAMVAAALVATQPRPAVAQGCSFQAFDAEFRQLTTNYPQRSHWGARDTYQYSSFLGVRGLEILSRHAPCMSGPDVQANQAALEGMRDQGLRGCQQLSTNPSSCTPNYPA
jgi:hypothetical protein